MKVTFLTPPSLDGFKPAERTAGCTRVVYNMVNIYELTVAALLEKEGYDVYYKNFVVKIADSLYVFINQCFVNFFVSIIKKDFNN